MNQSSERKGVDDLSTRLGSCLGPATLASHWARAAARQDELLLSGFPITPRHLVLLPDERR